MPFFNKKSVYSSLPSRAPMRKRKIKKLLANKKGARKVKSIINKKRKTINKGRKKSLHVNLRIREKDMKLRNCSYPMDEIYEYRRTFQ